MTPMLITEEQRLPDAEGWWARHHGGKVRWFHVEVLDDAGPNIWVSEIEDFVPVAKFSSPLTRWAGPVRLPWDPR